MNLTFCAPCIFGLEGYCANEFRFLGLENVRAENGRVLFDGDYTAMARANINARYAGNVMDLNYNATIKNGELTSLDITDIKDSGKDYDVEWDYLTVSANNSTKWGTGLSLTYAYKKNFSWKVFCDYDFTRKHYTLTYDPDYYVNYAMPEAIGMAALEGQTTGPEKHTLKKDVNSWVVGASFAVSF